MAIRTEFEPDAMTLPREIAPGVSWVGECMELSFHGALLHTYDSALLIRGEEASVLVEAGMPEDRTSDYHLFFPQFEDRLLPMEIGDTLDLGGTELVVVEAVIKDLTTSLWAVDSRSRTLFPGDGFAYAHYNEAAHCGHLAEEATALGLAEEIARFSEQSLHWARFTDMEPYIERLRRLLVGNEIEYVGPTHGLPISDLEAVLPTVEEGLRLASIDLPDGHAG